MGINIQELFDKIVIHLANQKIQSVEGGSCRYRTSNGLSCAVGCLIPDDKYQPEFDSGLMSVFSVVEKSGIFDMNDEDYIKIALFLGDMQKAHDKLIEGTDYDAAAAKLRYKLIEIAKYYNLDTYYVKNIKTWRPTAIV